MNPIVKSICLASMAEGLSADAALEQAIRDMDVNVHDLRELRAKEPTFEKKLLYIKAADYLEKERLRLRGGFADYVSELEDWDGHITLENDNP